jgi:alginate O-acetyltransferase complex protein AlgI
MLYNSFQFIFVFLPIALIGFLAASRFRTNLVQMSWIVLMSCLFYAYWDPIYIILLVGSLCFNFIAGRVIQRWPHKAILATGIVFNLFLLGYFKYRAFVLINVSELMEIPMEIPKLVLPLGISFFTFQKIAYLVDVYRGIVKDASLLRYATFITFFPQLIAGPIVHYLPLMRQFAPERPRTLRWSDLSIGLMFFIIGLTKKVVVADNLAAYADRLYSAAQGSIPLGFFEAWLAVFAYTFQIYFDFSGYSDMAIGLARMFGIRLPINFNSPYKAASFIDFWRRWHITLSRFLRDYVYIPLGGNHYGIALQVCSLLVTMLLGGLWHGASWTFVLWGGVHGLLLATNHVWLTLGLSARAERLAGARAYHAACVVITFLTVSVAWILFRAESLAGAMFIFNGLVGRNGFAGSIPEFVLLHGVPANGLVSPILQYFSLTQSWSVVPITATAVFTSILFSVWVFPNSQQIMSYRTGLPAGSVWRHLRWRPNVAWFVVAAALFYSSLACMVRLDIRPFTYFAF